MGGGAIWSSGRDFGSDLAFGQQLQVNDWLSSPTRKYVAKLYPDGQFKIEPTNNVARFGIASQTDAISGASASRAIDGNTDGNWSSGTITHTSKTESPFWEVDLGSDQYVGTIRLHNRTDCCYDRLAHFDVSVRNSAGRQVYSDYQRAPVGDAPGVFFADVTGRHVRVELRRVDFLSLAEVEIEGLTGTLLYTWGGDHEGNRDGHDYVIRNDIGGLMLLRDPTAASDNAVWYDADGNGHDGDGGEPYTQCSSFHLDDHGSVSCIKPEGWVSTGRDLGEELAAGDKLYVGDFLSSEKGKYIAKLFADGNFKIQELPDAGATTNIARFGTATQSSDLYGQASLGIDGELGQATHTDRDDQAWWQVDLGSDRQIKDIKVYNRIDCCMDRLSDFDVSVTNSSGTVVWTEHHLSAVGHTPATFFANVTGQYVKVQLRGNNYLSVKEVEVFGVPAPRTVQEWGRDPAPRNNDHEYFITSETGPKLQLFRDSAAHLENLVWEETEPTLDAKRYGTSSRCTFKLSDQGALRCLADDLTLWSSGRNLGSVLAAGEHMFENDWLSSPSGRYIARLYRDGNLKVQQALKGGRPTRTLYETGKDPRPNAAPGRNDYYVKNEASGLILVRGTVRNVLNIVWRVGGVVESEENACDFSLDDHGRLVCKVGDAIHWTSGMNRGTGFSHGQRIYRNDWLASPNKKYTAKLHGDGNFKIERTRNLARFGTATQSSTAFGGSASRAIDGNTNGVWNKRSVTHTEKQSQPWWKVDLGAEQHIDEIKIYNRTHCCMDRLRDFDIYVLNQRGDLVRSMHHAAAVGMAPAVFSTNAKGRFVKISLRGKTSCLWPKSRYSAVPA